MCGTGTISVSSENGLVIRGSNGELALSSKRVDVEMWVRLQGNVPRLFAVRSSLGGNAPFKIPFLLLGPGLFLGVLGRTIGKRSCLLRNIAITSNGAIILRKIRIRNCAPEYASFILATMSLTSETYFIGINRRILTRLFVCLRYVIARLLKGKRGHCLVKDGYEKRIRGDSCVILFNIRSLLIVYLAGRDGGNSIGTMNELSSRKGMSLVNFKIGMIRLNTQMFLVTNGIRINTIVDTISFTPTRKRRRLSITNYLDVIDGLLVIIMSRVLNKSARVLVVLLTMDVRIFVGLNVNTFLTRNLRLRLLRLSNSRNRIAKNSFISRNLAGLASKRKRLYSRKTLGIGMISVLTLDIFKTRMSFILKTFNCTSRNFRRRIRFSSFNRIILTTIKTKSEIDLSGLGRLDLNRTIDVDIKIGVISRIIYSIARLTLFTIGREIARKYGIT